MDNRFAEKIKQDEELDAAGKDFWKTVIELGKEIAEKGKRGVELTQLEKAFMKNFVIFMLRGFIGR